MNRKSKKFSIVKFLITFLVTIITLFSILYLTSKKTWGWLCEPRNSINFVKIEGGKAIFRPEKSKKGGAAKISNKVKQILFSKGRELLSKKIKLRVGDRIIEKTCEEIGFRIDFDETVRGLNRICDVPPDPLSRFVRGLEIFQRKITIPVVFEIDEKTEENLVLEIKKEFDTPPRDAGIGFENGVRKILKEKNGRFLDFYGALGAIEDISFNSINREIILPFVEIPASITETDLSTIDVTKTLSAYETKFSRAGKDNRGRAHNIELAASILNGRVIMPGKVFSFNEAVGPRSSWAGFEEAPEIYEGEMVTGVGGGVCQVASTLHASAFLGGLDITQRFPHSRPSPYIPMGLDATVIWPVIDLKIRNPYPFPVMIKASVDKNKLKIELSGAQKPVKVVWWTKILEEIPFEEQVEYDNNLPDETIITKQKGINGYKIKKTRKIIFANGQEKVETWTERYPPTPQLLIMNPTTFSKRASIPVASAIH